MSNRQNIKKYSFKIWALLISIVVLFILYKNLLPQLPSSNMLNEAFWSKKVTNANKFDIVFIGDSRIYRGISPREIELELNGLKIYNFGFSSAGIDSLILDKGVNLLKEKGKKEVYLGISVNSFLKESLMNEHLKSWIKKDKKDLWIKSNFYEELSLFDSYKISDFFKIIQKDLYYEKFDLEKGFVYSNRTKVGDKLAIEAYENHFKKEYFDTTHVNLVMKEIAKFQQKGIRFKAIVMPISKGLADAEDKYFGKEKLWLFSKFKSFGVEIIEFNNQEYQTFDGSHLKGESAIILSKNLAKSIK